MPPGGARLSHAPSSLSSLISSLLHSQVNLEWCAPGGGPLSKTEYVRSKTEHISFFDSGPKPRRARTAADCRLEVKDLRELTDLTIHDVKPIRDK